MGIRGSAQQAAASLADVRDNLTDRTKLIVGLLGALVAIAGAILITVLARR